MRKATTGVIFIISCIVDIYTFIGMLNELTISDTLKCLLYILNISLLISCVFLILEMRKVRLLGNISIDDIDLTVISQKNIKRKKINIFMVDGIEYKYVFFNNGFDAYIRFKGRVKKRIGKVKGIALNFSGDSNQTNDSIDAYAYDMISDANKKNKIKGKIAKRSGLNKEVFFRFKHPMKHNEKFDYIFHYRWNDCLNPQKDYIAMIPPFKYINPNVIDLKVVFEDKKVNCFETYSVNNCKVKKEVKIKPSYKGNKQIFKYKYTLNDDFNFAVAVFYFE